MVNAYWNTQNLEIREEIVVDICTLIQTELNLEYMKEEVHAMMYILWKEIDRVTEKYLFELSVYGCIKNE